MFLLDTNIISELARAKPNPNVLNWAAKVSEISVSVITVEEIFYGLSWKPNSQIQEWFESFFESNCQIFLVTADIAKLSGELRGRFQSQG